MFNDRERRQYWAQRNVSDRAQLLSKICRVDVDIKIILFAFDSIKLSKFFHEYEKKHGRRSMMYAKRSFQNWKNGNKSVSNLILERMIEIAPKFFEQDQRYKIVKKIYESSKQQGNYSFVIILGDDQDIQKVLSFYQTMIETPFSHTISNRVRGVMSWVCEEDVSAFNKILSALDSETSLLISTAATFEMNDLIKRIKSLEKSVVGKHVVTFPFGKVTVIVRNQTTSEKIFKGIRGLFL